MLIDSTNAKITTTGGNFSLNRSGFSIKTTESLEVRTKNQTTKIYFIVPDANQRENKTRTEAIQVNKKIPINENRNPPTQRRNQER